MENDFLPTKEMSNNNNNSNNNSGSKTKKKPLSVHLIAGGGAGFMEALCCHPLDTIKVRMQLRGRQSSMPANIGFVGVGKRIVQREGVLALYKGLGAVISGIGTIIPISSL